MQEAGLSHRFLADWPALHTPQGELVYGVPRRQNELINIGRQQLEIQRSAAEDIVRSNIDAADIIANEIRQQTEALEVSLGILSDQLSSSVMDAADQVCGSINMLGDRLCAYLGEITWNLAQIARTSAGILHALRHSRSNEARQLVEQGVRHYINEQYEQAEERFKLALKLDTTDYQVLLNLGLIAIQKGFSTEAHTFFQDALRLPGTLDKSSKNRALLMIARLHYADEEYYEALLYARKAATVANSDQIDEVFLHGTYAALAGQVSECLGELKQAIRAKPSLFGKAAVDPNLESCRSDVLALLSRLALEVQDQINHELEDARQSLDNVNSHAESSLVIRESNLAAKTIDIISDAIRCSSYCDSLHLLTYAKDLTRAIGLIFSAADAAARKSTLENQIPSLEAYAEGKETELQELQQIHPFRIQIWPLWHFFSLVILISLAVFLMGVYDRAGFVVLMVAAWWLWIGLGVWPYLEHLSNKRATSIEGEQALRRSTMEQAASVSRDDILCVVSNAKDYEQKSDQLLERARRVIGTVAERTNELSIGAEAQ